MLIAKVFCQHFDHILLMENLFRNSACAEDGQISQNPMMNVVERLMTGGRMDQIDSGFNMDYADQMQDL